MTEAGGVAPALAGLAGLWVLLDRAKSTLSEESEPAATSRRHRTALHQLGLGDFLPKDYLHRLTYSQMYYLL